MSTKKCACFTPSGLVYTRLETDGTIARRPVDHNKDNTTRSRRSLDNDVYEPNTVDSILKENPSIGHLSFKNEPIDEIENREIKEKIDKLIKETEAFLEAYERTKDNIDHKRIKRRAQHLNHNKNKQKNDAVINSNESSLECKIEKDGTVNCSQVIYNDLKAWISNRLSIEDQIRQLRTKLEDLKEIKRHLKTTKPIADQQTLRPPPNINLHTKNITHEHNMSTHEHIRKGRLHKVRTKHRNSTIFDKKYRQSNEYVIPTINAHTKDDIFDIQLKNESTTSTTVRVSTAEELTTKLVNELHYTESPKPQSTTIVVDHHYFSPSVIEAEKSTFSTTEDISTTDFMKQHGMTNIKQLSNEENSTDQGALVNFSQRAQYYNSEIDKVLATEDSLEKARTELPVVTSTTAAVTTTSHGTTTSINLGPARLDASEYEQRNPNKGMSKFKGILDRGADNFQRRLHPLYIENEDKHVCYCEENRLVYLLFINWKII